MASTITVQDVVDWARTLPKLTPIIGAAGFSDQPAVTIANNVMQEMLAPPFNWKWNRKEAASFDTVDGSQDYTASITDLGWLESAQIEDKANTSTPKPIYDIEVVQNLSKDFLKGIPQNLSWQPAADGSTSTIRFRLWPVPSSVVYTVYPIYQKKAPLITSLSSTWAPIPDELGYVIRQGFLAHALLHADDARANAEYMKFRDLLGKALAENDVEPQHEAFFPERSLMLG